MTSCMMVTDVGGSGCNDESRPWPRGTFRSQTCPRLWRGVCTDFIQTSYFLHVLCIKLFSVKFSLMSLSCLLPNVFHRKLSRALSINDISAHLRPNAGNGDVDGSCVYQIILGRRQLLSCTAYKKKAPLAKEGYWRARRPVYYRYTIFQITSTTSFAIVFESNYLQVRVLSRWLFAAKAPIHRHILSRGLALCSSTIMTAAPHRLRKPLNEKERRKNSWKPVKRVVTAPKESFPKSHQLTRMFPWKQHEF